jgi:hypothetical protein
MRQLGHHLGKRELNFRSVAGNNPKVEEEKQTQRRSASSVPRCQYLILSAAYRFISTEIFVGRDIQQGL